MRAAAKGCCPRCGRGALFDGLVRFRAACPACGLDYGTYNVGDGPAAFLTLGVGTLVLVLAITVEFGLKPPLAVHLVLWPLVTLGMVLGGLRIAKALLLASEYLNDAREAGRRP